MTTGGKNEELGKLLEKLEIHVNVFFYLFVYFRVWG